MAILKGLTGKSEGACRKFLGEMLKHGKDDCAAALLALRDARKERPAEPGAWLMATIKARTAPKQSAKAQALARAAADIDMAGKTHNHVLTIDGKAEERVAGNLEKIGSGG